MAREPRTQIEAQGRRGQKELRLASALILVSCIACVKTPEQRVEADLATMQSEHTPAKLLDRGRAFAAIGDLTRAEDYLAAAIDSGADPREAMPILLDVCVRSGRYRSAIQHGENHLRKHPHDLRTRLVVGTLLAAIGEPKEARVQLEKVVATKPDEAQAHYVLAVVARDTENDVVAADKHFREYLRIEPNGSHAEEARASLLKRMP